MNALHVTNVAQVGPFLQIYGHKDKNLLNSLNENIQLYLPRLIETAPPSTQLDPTLTYLVHNPRSNKYFRCTLIDRPQPDRVTVEFIDYGNEFDVLAENIIPLNLSISEGRFLNTFPPIATKYILSQFQCCWQQNEIETIKKFINNTLLVINNECTQSSFRMISLIYEGLELHVKLIRDRLGAHITPTEQISVLMHMISGFADSQKSPNTQASESMRSSKYNPGRNLVPTRPLQSIATSRTPAQLIQNHLAPPKPSRAPQMEVEDIRPSFGSPPVFVANDLPIGSHHLVYASYTKEGPNLFSVQLKKNQPVLDRIMNDLPNVRLKNLSIKPSIGMACIARSSEDRTLYRAAIMNIQHNVCRVTFVDFGNSADVPHAEIYEIPDKFLTHKTFSMQFSLFDCQQLEPIDDTLKEYFFRLVRNEELELKVMPIGGPIYVQYCELFLKNRSVLELLKNKQYELRSYPNPRRLVDDDIAIIRYVKTAKQFYLQRTADIPKFDEMMDRLLLHCHQSKPLVRMPRVSECCAAMLDNDNNEWYRVQVMETIDQHRVVVQFVDFGFVADCTLHQLREISPEFMQLPRQVTECCVVDFEKVDDVPDTTNKQLEMMAEDRNNERRKFRVSLRDRLPNSVFVVNLLDESESPTLNVSSSLCKLLMPRKQYGNKNAAAKGQSSSTLSSSADYTSTTITTDASTTFSANSSSDPKWEGTTQSTPAQAKSAAANGPQSWNASNDSSIRLGKSREADGSEQRTAFIERIDEVDNRRDRSSNRISTGSSKCADDGGADRRNNNRNSKNWRNDDNSGSGYENNRKSGRRSTETNNYEKRNSRNIKDRLVLQKHLIPRFNKSSNRSTSRSRKPNGNGIVPMDIENNNNQMVESGFCSKSTSARSRSVESIAPEEFVGLSPSLPEPFIPLGAISKVVMVIWLTPHLFYVQIKSFEEECDAMMKRLQTFYQKRPAIAQQQVPIGAVVVVRQKSDSTFKRAKIIDYNADIKKYRAQMIDFGNKVVCAQCELFELEKSFTKLPPLAISCSLINVIRNRSREEILNLIDRYVDASKPMSCEFVETNDEVTFVKFSIDGVDLKTKMIEDDHLSEIPADVHHSRLVGQTIFIQPTSIKDLSCFRAQIFGCDVTFMCSYKNLKMLKTNPRLNAEFKQLEKSTILVRIDSVTSDNVLVLDIFVPFLDGQNTDSSTEIPPYPIFKDKHIVQVSHVESANEVYIQCVDHMDRLSVLLTNLYEFYINGGLAYHTPAVASLCVALSVQDEQYYRTVIERVEENNTVIVRYIDYGNCERLPLANLKHLDARFKQLNTFAIKMYLPLKLIVAKSDAMAEINKVTEDRDFTLNIIDYYRNEWVIDLTSHGFSLVGLLREKGFALSMVANEHRNMLNEKNRQPTTPVKEIPPTQPTASAVATENVAKSQPKGTAAYISHTDNPNRFYLHLEADENAVLQFAQSLQIVAPSLPPLTEFRAGNICIAQYSLDGEWYRAKIIDTDGEVTSVLFVDYGNTDTITNNSLLKKSNESFDQIKHYALPCALAVQPANSSEWNQSACEKMLAISEDLLHFEFISEEPSLCYVTLYDGDRDIAMELINEGYAEPVQQIKNGEKCFVSHVDSLDDFYIQMNSDSKALNLIEEYLSDVSRFETLAEYRAGTICIAQFEDGAYYRAQILNDCPNGDASKGIKVHFIDYGNTFMATELRLLPRSIAELPHLRKRCALRKAADIERWSEKAETQFQQITNMGETVLTVRLVKPDEKAIVELFIDDRNIGVELAALCEKRIRVDSPVDEHKTGFGAANRFQCYITHINSPEDFYVQLVDRGRDIEAMVTTLATADVLKHPLKSEEISKKLLCIARFDEDGCLYRAKVLEKVNESSYRVRFIDYGNESSATEFYELPAELSVDPLAVRCKLDVQIVNEGHREHLKKRLIQAAADDEDTFHTIEVIDNTRNPNVVKYYRNSVDISRLQSADYAADSSVKKMCTQIEEGAVAADKYFNGIVDNLPAN